MSRYLRVRPKRQRTAFSKKMYIFNVCLAAAVTAACFALMFMQFFFDTEYIDLSPVGYIVPSVFAELGVHSAFYIWLAKNDHARQHRDVNTPTEERGKRGG